MEDIDNIQIPMMLVAFVLAVIVASLGYGIVWVVRAIVRRFR